MAGTLQNLDAVSLMKELPTSSVDLVLTDIPYGIPDLGFVSHYKQYIHTDVREGKREPHAEFSTEMKQQREALRKSNEIEFDFKKVVEECIRISSGTVIIFCGKEQISPIYLMMEDKGMRRLLSWHKSNPLPLHAFRTYLNDTEQAVLLRKSKATFNARNKGGVFRYPVVTSQEHKYPARKPVSLFKELILDTTSEGDTVCDPFCGSGTTAVACIETKRNYICGDINPEAFEISRQRIGDTTPPLFV